MHIACSMLHPTLRRLSLATKAPDPRNAGARARVQEHDDLRHSARADRQLKQASKPKRVLLAGVNTFPRKNAGAQNPCLAADKRAFQQQAVEKQKGNAHHSSSNSKHAVRCVQKKVWLHDRPVVARQKTVQPLASAHLACSGWGIGGRVSLFWGWGGRFIEDAADSREKAPISCHNV